MTSLFASVALFLRRFIFLHLSFSFGIMTLQKKKTNFVKRDPLLSNLFHSSKNWVECLFWAILERTHPLLKKYRKRKPTEEVLRALAEKLFPTFSFPSDKNNLGKWLCENECATCIKLDQFLLVAKFLLLLPPEQMQLIRESYKTVQSPNIFNQIQSFALNIKSLNAGISSKLSFESIP